MDFIDNLLLEYSEKYSEQESIYLNELNRATHLKVMRPRMLSGHLQGRFLSFISHLSKPQNILEIGTYTGYSALCLAEGLTENGVLHTLDNNSEFIEFAQTYIEKSPLKNKIKTHFGNAIEILNQEPLKTINWDLVWIDADKENYYNYFNLIIEKVNIGGLIMADNVLWSGKVLNESEIANDFETQSLHLFNQKVSQDPRVIPLLLPLRDGIMILRRV